MALPTAHNYIIKNLIENLASLEANFLKPNILITLLRNTELGFNEFIEFLEQKDFSQELLENEKENIILIIKKLSVLEKASREKLSWATQFSEYLQANTTTK
jgi:anaerobic ribonucleoside-triphosphate reductase